MQYSRDIPAGASDETYRETVEHVKEHLSSVVSLHDDPRLYADMVTIVDTFNTDGTHRVTGSLPLQPVAPYLGNSHLAQEEGFTFEPGGGLE